MVTRLFDIQFDSPGLKLPTFPTTKRNDKYVPKKQHRQVHKAMPKDALTVYLDRIPYVSPGLRLFALRYNSSALLTKPNKDTAYFVTRADAKIVRDYMKEHHNTELFVTKGPDHN